MTYGNHPPEPRTLTRVGNLEGDLKESVERYNPKLSKLMKGMNMSEKYGVYVPERPSHLIIASKSLGEDHVQFGYNFILSVTSDFAELNREVAKRFEEQTEIVLRKAPEQLERFMQGINYTFGCFKKLGPRAMDFLLSA